MSHILFVDSLEKVNHKKGFIAHVGLGPPREWGRDLPSL